MDQSLLVQAAEGGCDTESEAQEPRNFDRPWKESIKGLTASVFEHKCRMPEVLGKGQGAEPPRPSPVRPSANIRSPSFLESPVPATRKQQLIGELMVQLPGSGTRPGIG